MYTWVLHRMNECLICHDSHASSAVQLLGQIKLTILEDHMALYCNLRRPRN